VSVALWQSFGSTQFPYPGTSLARNVAWSSTGSDLWPDIQAARIGGTRPLPGGHVVLAEDDRAGQHGTSAKPTISGGYSANAFFDADAKSGVVEEIIARAGADTRSAFLGQRLAAPTISAAARERRAPTHQSLDEWAAVVGQLEAASASSNRALRNRDNPSAMATPRNPPAAAQIIGRYPTASPSTPPNGAPMTIIARLIERIVAFMRPYRRSGVTTCR
jgi:hypothetical protein